MRSVTTVGIVFSGALLWCALARAQRNPDSPHSASTTEKSSIDQNTFDHSLQRVLRESMSRFRGLEGARLQNRLREYYYEAKISLPGAVYCRVLKHEGTTVYACEWENGKIVKEWYSPLVTTIERSLGPEWNKRQGPRPTGQQVIFFGDGKPTVQVSWNRKAAIVHVIVLPREASQNGIQTELPSRPDFFHPR